ncbi:LRR repeats and ubiquitin-like domain-containing protein [Dendrobium catenatum]|uniref:LRR repeats and ubiquitin-like domain-containing protein n=1 Tax=Dendrobium catenatum TaxID=906689 RepID=A0A2I0VY46_9ASPA|nr:LRR repeats and ubiquitin-like domain-containing protein [Dendrobium catenatum]
MGCLCSKNAESRTSRIARWNATGIVALRDSNLKVLPDEVLDVNNNVRTIDLTNNNVSVLPPDISRLVQLQRLILANNVLQSLPNTVASLRSLKILTLDGNKISILPDELGSLYKLEQLSVSGNLLTFLPDTIGKLHNLSLLNVSSNKLRSLPPSIGSCIALEELQANDNNIEELPESLCNLSHLKSLLPPKLFKDCKSMQNIALHSNPITSDQFQQMAGFVEFEERRKRKFDKQINSNVLMNSKGLDEGIDL